MLRFKRSWVGIAAIVGIWLLLPAAAYAGLDWFWNAVVDAEGVQIHTAWSVDDPDGVDNYRALITVAYPRGAGVQLVTRASNERVVLREDRTLACSDQGIQVRATYVVTPRGTANGHEVSVSLIADPNITLASASGGLRGQPLSVSAWVNTPAKPSCAP